jgi:deoxyhypusine synthase
MKSIKEFMIKHFRHFNASVCVQAAQGWADFNQSGGKMFLSLAGAMSTAELGISLAEMIRQKKVHGISCTGANLEEDIYNLIAHSQYSQIPNYRYLSKEEELELYNTNRPRVTDTCIPEDEAIKCIEGPFLKLWKKAEQANQKFAPYEYFYQILKSGELRQHYQIDPKDSWVLAACEQNIPIFVPGWEDSSLGNFFVSCMIKKQLAHCHMIKSGLEQMEDLVQWYSQTAKKTPVGFFQIGGGIAGDFPICVVPLLNRILEIESPFWSYFCQISDSTTSYGSYSGAVPNEKITWGKLSTKTASFVIESDATIVAPLIFQYVLDSK